MVSANFRTKNVISSDQYRRNGELCVVVGPVAVTAGMLANRMLAQSGLTLASSNAKGDELPHRL